MRMYCCLPKIRDAYYVFLRNTSLEVIKYKTIPLKKAFMQTANDNRISMVSLNLIIITSKILQMNFARKNDIETYNYFQHVRSI